MPKFNISITQYFSFSTLLLISWSLQASPWIETDDAYLRSDLQLLADAGVITVPVNTFPLPWREISEQINHVSPSALSINIRTAYYHINYKLNVAKKGYGNNTLKVKVAQENIPSSFAQDNDVKWGAFSNAEIDESLFSMRISANYAQYYDKENPQYNLDNSYFAVTTGKTNFFVNTQAQWWSPSWLQSLTAEQRVHSAYELGLERTFVDVPLVGDVYFKSGINQLRSSDDWKYSWRSRLSLRPNNLLEMSVSHFDFYDAQSDDIEEHEQQLSVDSRISLFSSTNLPLAFYTQHLLDDSQSEYSNYLFGSDYSAFVVGMQMRFVFEYRKMNEDDLRYSFGTYVQMENDHQWQLFLHHNNSDDLDNQLVGSYRFLVYKGMLSLSLLLSDTKEEDNINTAVSWELRF